VRAIQLRHVRVSAVPLLGALQWIHGISGNYGISIIAAHDPDQHAHLSAAVTRACPMRKMQALHRR
jgi:hypothetical protein